MGTNGMHRSWKNGIKWNILDFFKIGNKIDISLNESIFLKCGGIKIPY